MTSHPTAVDLLDAVSRFIDERARPRLDERDAYLARVAVTALAIVRRELEQGPAAQAAAAQRLTALLGYGGDLPVLNGELCDRLASGELDLASPGVMAHLKASAIDRVSIDQPTYSGLKTVAGRA
jgi:hypothetical protein